MSEHPVQLARELRSALRDLAIEDVYGLGMVCKLCGARGAGGDSNRLIHAPDCILKRSERL